MSADTETTQPEQGLFERAKSSVLRFFFSGWSASSDLTAQLLNNSDSPANANTRLQRWCEQQQSHLHFVATTSALVAATVATCLGWSNVEAGPTITFACWYSALLMAIVSITCALQQHDLIQRMAFVYGYNILRDVLRSSQNDPDGTHQESKLQHYVWQTPIMLNNFSVVLFVIGLLGLVFSHTLPEAAKNSARSRDVIIVFAVAVAFTIGNYLVAWQAPGWKLESAVRARQAQAQAQAQAQPVV